MLPAGQARRSQHQALEEAAELREAYQVGGSTRTRSLSSKTLFRFLPNPTPSPSAFFRFSQTPEKRRKGTQKTVRRRIVP
eukprot:1937-Prorocentrum_minimum.AAC.2